MEIFKIFEEKIAGKEDMIAAWLRSLSPVAEWCADWDDDELIEENYLTNEDISCYDKPVYGEGGTRVGYVRYCWYLDRDCDSMLNLETGEVTTSAAVFGKKFDVCLDVLRIAKKIAQEGSYDYDEYKNLAHEAGFGSEWEAAEVLYESGDQDLREKAEKIFDQIVEMICEKYDISELVCC